MIFEETTPFLTRHAFFEDAHIAKNAFGCFHRNDGLSIIDCRQCSKSCSLA